MQYDKESNGVECCANLKRHVVVTFQLETHAREYFNYLAESSFNFNATVAELTTFSESVEQNLALQKENSELKEKIRLNNECKGLGDYVDKTKEENKKF